VGLSFERLYYDDSYLTEFQARVVERSADGRRLCLDRTAFYPASGGQPHDLGWIADVPVIEVLEEGERIVHVTAEPVKGEEVACRIDWPRRFDYMQQHSGQHVLSAALVELFKIPTVGFHLGAEISAIDLEATALEPAQVAAVEERANQIVFENRPVRISYEEAGQTIDLRKPSEREGTLRIVSIEGLDRSACGGTHVRATGEIGPILIRRLDRAHGGVRLEFLCGARAVRRARADFDALNRIARLFSAPPDETPALVQAQSEALQAAERARRRLATEVASFRGRELYAATAPDAGGTRRVLQRLRKGAIDDELRATAQSFTAQPKAVFLAVIEEPPAALLAASKDVGINAGEALKAALGRVGGRGGGSAVLAQGSAPSREPLEAVIEELQG
jgi:alanyl-tRNA synthetase